MIPASFCVSLHNLMRKDDGTGSRWKSECCGVGGDFIFLLFGCYELCPVTLFYKLLRAGSVKRIINGCKSQEMTSDQKSGFVLTLTSGF